nr:hypothetical protein [Anaerolineae bacterium]
QATEYALRALDCLPEDSLTMRSLATTMASTGLVSSGDLDRAVNTLKKAAAMGYKARNTHATMIALCDAAQLQIAQARLHPAAQTCKDAFHYAEEHIHHTSRQVLLSGYASTIYSTILYQWNDLDQALYHAERGIELSEQWQVALVVCHGYVALTRVNRARGDYVRALAAIQSAEHFLAENHISELPCLDQLIAEKNRLALLMGDRPAVYRYIQECQLAPGSDITTANHTGCLTLARTMLACRHHDDALALLTDCASFAVRQGRIFNLIEARILQALTHQSKGADSRALVMLEEALELAYPEQLIRVFLDEGEAMSCLLYKAAAHSLYPDYTGRLLALFPAGGKPARYESDDSVYIEPLSDRELEVLCLIAEGRSNSEAADQLVVSLNTVKKHATNIFNKLGVTSRTQAVARARSLGILPGNGSGHST